MELFREGVDYSISAAVDMKATQMAERIDGLTRDPRHRCVCVCAIRAIRAIIRMNVNIHEGYQGY